MIQHLKLLYQKILTLLSTLKGSDWIKILIISLTLLILGLSISVYVKERKLVTLKETRERESVYLEFLEKTSKQLSDTIEVHKKSVKKLQDKIVVQDNKLKEFSEQIKLTQKKYDKIKNTPIPVSYTDSELQKLLSDYEREERNTLSTIIRK